MNFPREVTTFLLRAIEKRPISIELDGRYDRHCDGHRSMRERCHVIVIGRCDGSLGWVFAVVVVIVIVIIIAVAVTSSRCYGHCATMIAVMIAMVVAMVVAMVIVMGRRYKSL